MKRKNIILILTAAGILIIAATGITYFLSLPAAIVRFTVPWQNQVYLKQIKEAGEQFHENNPRIIIEVTGMELGKLNDIWKSGRPADAFDLAVTASAGNPQSVYNEEYTPWTGVIWSLYYNKELLAGAGWDDNPPENFTDGTASITDFEAVLKKLHDNGTVPINAGGRYVWPFAAWIQHLGLYEDASQDLNSWKSGSPLPESTVSALSRFNNWKTSGWINSDLTEKDWPASVIETAAGKSAFVLIPSSLSTTIPPSQQDAVGLIPFPAGQENRWVVGSLWFLAIPADSDAAEAAMKFADYLTKGETVMELQKNTGLRFFPSTPGEAERLHPSVTNNINSDFIKYIRSTLRQY